MSDHPIARPPPPSVRDRLLNRPHLGILSIAEDVVHYTVALVLVTVAAIVLYHTARDLVTTHQPFAAAATTAVNGVLFAIIVLEVMRTVVAHFEHGGLQLQPFLIIGIISAVREILTVGARLSLQGAVRAEHRGRAHRAAGARRQCRRSRGARRCSRAHPPARGNAGGLTTAFR